MFENSNRRDFGDCGIEPPHHQTAGPRPARAAEKRSERRQKSGQTAVNKWSNGGQKGVGRSRTISPGVRPRASDRARGGQKLSKWSKSGQKVVKKWSNVAKRPFRHQAAGQAATGMAPKRHHEKRVKENGQRKMAKNDGRKGGPGRRRRRAANRGQIASWSNRSEGFLGFFLGGGVSRTANQTKAESERRGAPDARPYLTTSNRHLTASDRALTASNRRLTASDRALTASNRCLTT